MKANHRVDDTHSSSLPPGLDIHNCARWPNLLATVRYRASGRNTLVEVGVLGDKSLYRSGVDDAQIRTDGSSVPPWFRLNLNLWINLKNQWRNCRHLVNSQIHMEAVFPPVENPHRLLRRCNIKDVAVVLIEKW